jgi:hypothetical protein
LAYNSGRFKKGQSGNPGGMVKGTRRRYSHILDNMLKDEGKGLARKLIDLALGGNERCLLALKDHLWPSPKGRAVEIDIGEVSDAATALSGIAKIIEAMGAGEVTPDEATTLTSPLEKYLRATEIAELEARVAALENAP